MFNHTSIQNSAELLPVDGTHASTIALLYMYTVLDLRLYMVHMLQLLAWFCCIIICFVISSACPSVLFAHVLTTLIAMFYHTWELDTSALHKPWAVALICIVTMLQ